MNEFDTLVITHGCCQDGLSAVWVAKQYLSGKNIRYVFAMKRDLEKDITPLSIEDLEGKDVYILDYSYTYESLSRLNYKSLTLIDHHSGVETEMEKCKSLPRCTVVFSLNMSGVGLTWTHLFPEKEMPWWIQYIQDRDLWLWKLPHSKVINTALYNLGYKSFAKFDELQLFTQKDIEELIEKGLKMEDIKNSIITQISNTSHICMFDNHKVCAVQTSVLASEVGEELYTRSQEYDFVLIFSYNFREKQYNIRLRSNKIDVSIIAQKYGGNGHEGAAGFKYKGDFLSLLTDIQ